MYTEFDNFINKSTWSTGHEEDRKRFYKALAKTINKKDFSPQKLREYLLIKVGLEDYINTSFVQENDRHYGYFKIIDDLITKVYGIQEYMELINS